MNWVGGARSRIKGQHEKKVQREFFDKKKYSTKVECARPAVETNKRRGISQDLLTFRTVNMMHSNKGKTTSENRVHRVDLDKHTPLFTPRNYNELPMSPIKVPSSIELNSASSETTCAHHENKRTKWKSQMQQEKFKAGLKPLQSPLFSQFNNANRYKTTEANSFKGCGMLTGGELQKKSCGDLKRESEFRTPAPSKSGRSNLFSLNNRNENARSGDQTSSKTNTLGSSGTKPKVTETQSKWNIYTCIDNGSNRNIAKRNAFAVEDFQVTPIKRKKHDNKENKKLNYNFKFPEQMDHEPSDEDFQNKFSRRFDLSTPFSEKDSFSKYDQNTENPLCGINYGSAVKHETLIQSSQSDATSSKTVYSEDPLVNTSSFHKGKYCSKSKFKNSKQKSPLLDIKKEPILSTEDPLFGFHWFPQKHLNGVKNQKISREKEKLPEQDRDFDNNPFLSLFRNLNRDNQLSSATDAMQSNFTEDTPQVNASEDPLCGIADNRDQMDKELTQRNPGSKFCDDGRRGGNFNLNFDFDSQTSQTAECIENLDENPLGDMNKSYNIVLSPKKTYSNSVPMHKDKSPMQQEATITPKLEHSNTTTPNTLPSSVNWCSSPCATVVGSRVSDMDIMGSSIHDSYEPSYASESLIDTSKDFLTPENRRVSMETPSSESIRRMIGSMLDGLTFTRTPAPSPGQEEGAEEEIGHEKSVVSSAVDFKGSLGNDSITEGNLVLHPEGKEEERTQGIEGSRMPLDKGGIITTSTETISVSIQTESSENGKKCASTQTDDFFNATATVSVETQTLNITCNKTEQTYPLFFESVSVQTSFKTVSAEEQLHFPDFENCSGKAYNILSNPEVCSVTCGIGTHHFCDAGTPKNEFSFAAINNKSSSNDDSSQVCSSLSKNAHPESHIKPEIALVTSESPPSLPDSTVIEQCALGPIDNPLLKEPLSVSHMQQGLTSFHNATESPISSHVTISYPMRITDRDRIRETRGVNTLDGRSQTSTEVSVNGVQDIENLSYSQHNIDTASSSQDSTCSAGDRPRLRRSRRFCVPKSET